MTNKLPEFLKPYFWDVDFEKLNIERSAEFITHRLLNKGNLEAVLWVQDTYPMDLIKKVLKNNQDFSFKTASFWGLIYGIPLSELKCFQTPYHQIREALWPY